MEEKPNKPWLSQAMSDVLDVMQCEDLYAFLPGEP